ncbi:unnamed protein product [Cuscuta europaea]|uniref:RRM domain-containing protein n=1 Tax=Cuscuta europaea TaxID=41803 RepID=A0A9P1EL42_CUSEU|nr:unnamed protein product [Cuscuta europaea]
MFHTNQHTQQNNHYQMAPQNLRFAVEVINNSRIISLAACSMTNKEVVDASTKVYVGGIPYYFNKDDIRSFFGGYGTITEIDSMIFPDTGKFRGIAIINFKII